ncbi:MAG: hypothetical protein ACREUN_13965, partial [Burkholderiales bacterium]
MALLAVAVMAFAYVLVSRLNAASMFVGVDREHNAKVMARAKRALVGYVAQQASLAVENNPGRLPCPEASAFFGDPAQEGIAAGNCTLPAVGRLPWRTLGLEKLVDADAEPLWYVVSPGWALSNSTVPPLQTLINSDSPGQLAVDGAPPDSVALIIAPGAAMAVQAGAGCAAWAQTRPAAGPLDRLNYLECGNEAGNFVTAAPGGTFNDQVLRVTTADLMPTLEAAIAHRMEREIVPALRGVYSSAPWGGYPLFAYPAPFSDPGTSSYKGVAATAGSDKPQGLLPFVYSETGSGSGAPCTPGGRCDPLFVAWTVGTGTLSGPGINSPSCTVVTGTTTRLDCTFYYTCGLITCTPPTLSFTIQAQAASVAMALRQINLSAPVGSANVSATLTGASGALSTNGSATMTLTGTATPDGSGAPLSAVLGNTFCGLPIIGPLLGCKQSLISVPIGVLADHPLLDPGDPTTGWFMRNEWYRLTYYAAALKNTAWGLPPPLACNAVPNCLSRNYPTPSMNNIRSLIILAGRSIS